MALPPMYLSVTSSGHHPVKYPGQLRQDQYKRASMAALVIIASLLMLAADGMNFSQEVFYFINAFTYITWYNYLLLGIGLWSLANNILTLLCAIGNFIHLWSNLIIYMSISWVIALLFMGWQAYANVIAYLKETNAQIKEEYIFTMILLFAIDIIYCLRQICFMRMYNIPSLIYYYLLPK